MQNAWPISVFLWSQNFLLLSSVQARTVPGITNFKISQCGSELMETINYTYIYIYNVSTYQLTFSDRGEGKGNELNQPPSPFVYSGIYLETLKETLIIMSENHQGFT